MRLRFSAAGSAVSEAYARRLSVVKRFRCLTLPRLACTVARMNDDTAAAALKRAIEIAGSQKKLARRFVPPIAQTSVAKWVRKGRVPAERALELERVLEAQVTRYELRPDLYPRAGA